MTGELLMFNENAHWGSRTGFWSFGTGPILNGGTDHMLMNVEIDASGKAVDSLDLGDEDIEVNGSMVLVGPNQYSLFLNISDSYYSELLFVTIGTIQPGQDGTNTAAFMVNSEEDNKENIGFLYKYDTTAFSEQYYAGIYTMIGAGAVTFVYNAGNTLTVEIEGKTYSVVWTDQDTLMFELWESGASESYLDTIYFFNPSEVATGTGYVVFYSIDTDVDSAGVRALP